jgi:hypothetical protein
MPGIERRGVLAVLCLVVASARAGGDVWDPGDDTNGSANQLLPGTRQLHDLASPSAGGADEDWYFVQLPHRTSWEFVMEGMGPGVGGASDPFTLVDPAGGLVLNSDFYLGPARSLHFEQAGPDTVYFVRARSTGCATTCGPEAVYEIRARETSLAVPRFNNSATQTTVLILQNRSSSFAVGGRVWFLAPSGQELGSQLFNLGASQALVLNTSTVPGAAGEGGTMVVTHDGRYGQLEGKAVALEPATGFTFDTPVLHRAQ